MSVLTASRKDYAHKSNHQQPDRSRLGDIGDLHAVDEREQRVCRDWPLTVIHDHSEANRRDAVAAEGRGKRRYGASIVLGAQTKRTGPHAAGVRKRVVWRSTQIAVGGTRATVVVR